MNKLPLILTTAAVSATAVIGVLTKNKINSLQQNLRTTKTELGSTTKVLESTKVALSKTTDDLLTANKALEEEKVQLADATKERDEAKMKVSDLAQTLQDREMKLAQTEKDLANFKKEMETFDPGDALNHSDVATMQTQIKDLQAQITSLKENAEALTAKLKASNQALAASKERVQHYEMNVAKLGLTGRVVAVNAGWNFVVLNVGDKNGAAINAPLIVSRNGQNIARLKITSVEPGTSVADIIPSSLPRGESVQPGDEVVFTRL